MRLYPVAVAFALAACATIPPGSGPPSSLTQIAGTELRNANGTNVEDALRQFRPEFLRANTAYDGRSMRPIAPSVYVDGVLTGTTDVLRMIPVSAVIEVRRLSASAAHDRFGTACRCAGGALLVTTRRE
jgi:hypothetical protein